MGLDQYMTAKKYIPGGYDHVRKNPNAAKEVAIFDTIVEYAGVKGDDVLPLNYAEVTIEVAYWRKANAIHKWFVANVQDGTDDCGTYEVSFDQLRSLLEICKAINKSVIKGEVVKESGIFGEYETYPDMIFDTELAKQTLPSQEGFFFGSTDYNDGYIYDVERTIVQIERLIEKFAPTEGTWNGWTLYYSSSW